MGINSSESLIDINEVSKFFNVSLSIIQSWIKKDIISKESYIKVGSTYRFQLTAVIKSIQNKNIPDNEDIGSYQEDFDIEVVDTNIEEKVSSNKLDYFEKLEIASESGDLDASFKLAQSHEIGNGTEINLEEAFNNYEICALHGNKDAQFQLGKFFEEGIGVEIDKKESLKFYTLSSNQGHKEAFKKVNKNIETNKKNDHFNNSISKIKEVLRSNNESEKDILSYIGDELTPNVADLIRTFPSIKTDWNNEVTTYYDDYNEETLAHNASQKEFEQNSINRKIILKDDYTIGQEYYKMQNYEKAFKYFQKSSFNEHDHKAQYMIGYCYYVGKGVHQNDDEAIKNFHMSANQNNKDALYILGDIYFYGEIVDEDDQKALYYFNLSHDYGNLEAQKRINIILNLDKDL